jgi:chromosome segregation ATPase
VAKDDEMFREALVGKKIPILTLDHQWHKLFTQTGENDKLSRLENKLNDLLKEQGRLNAEIKSLSAYKKKLMQEIVDIMELPDSDAKEKKMSNNKNNIEETNQKIADYNDKLLDMPKEIDNANYELMLATMHICYEKIQKNVEDIDAINQWVSDLKVKLKKKVIQKKQMEIWNDELYSYMHSLFGPEVIDMFDMKYNPKNVLNKEKDLVDNKNPKQE